MKNSDRNFARRIDLTSLQLFVAVCELGSIGRAAEREFIAASAVSKRLAELEAAVETALLYRHSRGVTLTPAGENLLHHARSVLFGLEKMQGELSEYADGVRGPRLVLSRAAEGVDRLGQHDPRPCAPAEQVPGGHESVAAVAAAAGEQQHAPARDVAAELAAGCLGDGQPGGLHQLQHIDAELVHHDLVDTRHLRRGRGRYGGHRSLLIVAGPAARGYA